MAIWQVALQKISPEQGHFSREAGAAAVNSLSPNIQQQEDGRWHGLDKREDVPEGPHG